MRSDAIAALLFAAALGCTHAAPPPDRTGTPAAAPGERFRLRKGDSLRITGTHARITFEKVVSDNRCPVDVACVIAGEARVLFRLDELEKSPLGFELDTGKNPNATVNGYAVALLLVSPAPRSTAQIDPQSYVVELTVTPR
ncbi:MAG TPA: hypothetical protein VF958_11910 [Thermoanaerobaculia bacterium]